MPGVVIYGLEVTSVGVPSKQTHAPNCGDAPSRYRQLELEILGFTSAVLKLLKSSHRSLQTWYDTAVPAAMKFPSTLLSSPLWPPRRTWTLAVSPAAACRDRNDHDQERNDHDKDRNEILRVPPPFHGRGRCCSCSHLENFKEKNFEKSARCRS